MSGGKTISPSVVAADCLMPAGFLKPYHQIASLHYIYVRVESGKKKNGAHAEQSGCTPMHIKN